MSTPKGEKMKTSKKITIKLATIGDSVEASFVDWSYLPNSFFNWVAESPADKIASGGSVGSHFGINFGFVESSMIVKLNVVGSLFTMRLYAAKPRCKAAAEIQFLDDMVATWNCGWVLL